MKITIIDVVVFLLGVTCAVLGATYDMHSWSFLGGSLCGAFAFNMGWKFEEWWGGE